MMMTAYKPLFGLEFKHSYYLNEGNKQDYLAQPSGATGRYLNDHGFIFRANGGDFSIYAEVVSQSSPPLLARSVGDGGMRLVFLVQAVNPLLVAITEMPRLALGKSALYFNNLFTDTNETEDSPLLLGDNTIPSRIGESVRIVDGPICEYHFKEAVKEAVITVTDLFGNQVHQESFRLDENDQAVWTHRIDLGDIESIAPGFYKLTDDKPVPPDGEFCNRIYYDPEIFSNRPFAIIEIFSDTTNWNPGQENQVPQNRQFLEDGDGPTGQNLIAGIAPFQVQLEGKSIRWRYSVTHKHDVLVDLGQVTIEGDHSFDNPDPTDNPRIFTSSDPIPLTETPLKLALTSGDRTILTLPNPSPSSPFQRLDENSAELVAQRYVYV